MDITRKCPHCQKCYFIIDNEERCPFCGKKDTDFFDKFRNMFGDNPFDNLKGV